MSRSKSKAAEAARLMAMRSVRARIKKWGKAAFQRRMREWGKLGGRPPKASRKQKGGK